MKSGTNSVLHSCEPCQWLLGQGHEVTGRLWAGNESMNNRRQDTPASFLLSYPYRFFVCFVFVMVSLYSHEWPETW